MVSMLFKSTLREIRQSLGRFLAIFAIIGLGVGFFAGLRMAQPSMIATGVTYMEQYAFHDFRLLSTLGFTEEDVEAFSALEGVETARGSVYTQFIGLQSSETERVFTAHMITDGLNDPNLIVGRMPSAPNECLGDPQFFTADQLGSSIRISKNNSEDTLDLFVYDEYTLVGLADTPLYLNYERGTASIGSGSVTAFVLIPGGGFDYEVCHEIFLRLDGSEKAYSDAYQVKIDRIKASVESLLEERATLRYDTLYSDAMEEIRDGEKELSDGWEEYRSEKAKVDQELADAYQKLVDGEQEYKDGLADYEQGKLDYADGLQKYEDGLSELEDARIQLDDARIELDEGWAEFEKAKTELADSWAEFEKGKAELADGRAEFEKGKADLADGRAEFEKGKADLADGWAAFNNGKAELDSAKAEVDAGNQELSNAWNSLEDARKQLEQAAAQLEEGETSYEQLYQLYQAASTLSHSVMMDSPNQFIDLLNSGYTPLLNAAINQILKSQGSSLSEFLDSWAMAEASIGQSLDSSYLDSLRTTLDQGWAEYHSGTAAYKDGLAQYESGRAEIRHAEAEIEKAEQQLANAEAELLDGERELAAAEAELLDGERELADAEAELLDGERELADAEKELLDGEQKLADAEKELLDGEQELADGEAEYADGLAELADAKIELEEAKADLEQAPIDLAEGRAELDDGWQEYRDGSAEAEEEFADAEKELLDGEAEIADAYAKLADLKEPDTYSLTRKENVGYASFDNDTSIIAAISLVFPLFFFLVAALVCMTTMKRMVDEQRTQIGILKAIGYSKKQIVGKYLFYSGSAAFTGSLIGYFLGSWGLPVVIWEIYGIMYGFAPLEFKFDPGLAVISLAAALLCSMGSTWLSCRLELSRQAAELIRPKAPKAGKRIFLEYITPLWKRMSFLRKVSIRNVFRYRSRLIMMVLGIGGCTALLVTGFGIRDSIAFLPDDQFEKITLFDYSVNFQNPLTQEEADQFLLDCGWNSEDALLVHSGSTDVLTSTGSRSVYLIVPERSTLDGFISLHSGDTPIAFPEPGEVVINYALSRDLSVEIGDVITLRHDDLGSVEATASAICDNFIANYVFLSPETYRQQLGTVPEFKSLLIHSHPGADPYAESVILTDNDEVSNVTLNQASRDQLSSMLSRLNILVVVVVVCAAALAFIVLYNLTNININERIREIATIKVLGFYQGETATYVFREINMLSSLGSLVGLAMGKALHLFVMNQVKVDGMFFPTRINLSSYLFSLILTMVFTWLITLFMRPRLKKIDMAESLKSIE